MHDEKHAAENELNLGNKFKSPCNKQLEILRNNLSGNESSKASGDENLNNNSNNKKEKKEKKEKKPRIVEVKSNEDILEVLRELLSHSKDNKVTDDIKSEWIQLAAILDRLFFFIFLLFIVISTVALLFHRPHEP